MEPDLQRDWPCQRLRIGYGLVLFFVFEVSLGRQLPVELAFAALGLGGACLVSAFQQIRVWRFRAKVRLIEAAFSGHSS
ncbi:MAG TPA: hypothetical protein RMG48_17775 [Myxococcales bacterium LLY-WYZ-16_1]|nr:hypothetical protein [Myxococcales bacterium LLY-WYZ-16_1]